jgi:hypothetical protein
VELDEIAVEVGCEVVVVEVDLVEVSSIPPAAAITMITMTITTTILRLIARLLLFIYLITARETPLFR